MWSSPAALRGCWACWWDAGAILLAAFLYAAGYALELAGDSVRWIVLTYRIQHLTIAFVSTRVPYVAARNGDLAIAHRPALRWAAVALAAANVDFGRAWWHARGDARVRCATLVLAALGPDAARLRRAVAAPYRAKRAGGDRVVLDAP